MYNPIHQLQRMCDNVGSPGVQVQPGQASAVQVRYGKRKNRVKSFFRSLIHGLIEREKLIMNIYFLFRFDHCLPEKHAKQVE